MVSLGLWVPVRDAHLAVLPGRRRRGAVHEENLLQAPTALLHSPGHWHALLQRPVSAHPRGSAPSAPKPQCFPLPLELPSVKMATVRTGGPPVTPCSFRGIRKAQFAQRFNVAPLEPGVWRNEPPPPQNDYFRLLPRRQITSKRFCRNGNALNKKKEGKLNPSLCSLAFSHSHRKMQKGGGGGFFQ